LLTLPEYVVGDFRKKDTGTYQNLLKTWQSLRLEIPKGALTKTKFKQNSNQMNMAGNMMLPLGLVICGVFVDGDKLAKMPGDIILFVLDQD
jgi:hypothetical protein